MAFNGRWPPLLQRCVWLAASLRIRGRAQMGNPPALVNKARHARDKCAGRLVTCPPFVKHTPPPVEMRVSGDKPKGSNTLERRVQVGLKILDVLDTHRQPEKTIGEAHGEPRFARHGRVRHRGWMTHETLHAAEALGAREQLEAIEYTATGL